MNRFGLVRLFFLQVCFTVCLAAEFSFTCKHDRSAQVATAHHLQLFVDALDVISLNCSTPFTPATEIRGISVLFAFDAKLSPAGSADIHVGVLRAADPLTPLVPTRGCSGSSRSVVCGGPADRWGAQWGSIDITAVTLRATESGTKRPLLSKASLDRLVLVILAYTDGPLLTPLLAPVPVVHDWVVRSTDSNNTSSSKADSSMWWLPIAVSAGVCVVLLVIAAVLIWYFARRPKWLAGLRSAEEGVTLTTGQHDSAAAGSSASASQRPPVGRQDTEYLVRDESKNGGVRRAIHEERSMNSLYSDEPAERPTQRPTPTAPAPVGLETPPPPPPQETPREESPPVPKKPKKEKKMREFKSLSTAGLMSHDPPPNIAMQASPSAPAYSAAPLTSSYDWQPLPPTPTNKKSKGKSGQTPRVDDFRSNQDAFFGV